MALLEPVWKTRPGPLPAPSIRSGCCGTGFLFFGAGSMFKRADEPAPASSLGFFGGGRSSTLSSFGCSAGKEGKPIVIFLGPFFLGGGNEEPDEDAFGVELDSGGSERPVLLADFGAEAVGFDTVVTCVTSSSDSLPLP